MGVSLWTLDLYDGDALEFRFLSCREGESRNERTCFISDQSSLDGWVDST